jgi:hypothetical protein
VEVRRPISFGITDERIPDHKGVRKLLNDAKIKEDVYKFLKEKGLYSPGINQRTDSIVKPNTIRGESILEHHRFGPGR